VLDDILELFEKPKDPNDIEAIRLKLASTEVVRSWSRGEVKKPETINYRTFKPEKDGLFCARIFGPIKDWECLCGKYKKIKHRGIICDKCGVEVTSSRVRRERMGHIELAAPVAHIWYVKVLPSKIGLLLGISMKDLERVLYYDSYIVVDPGKTPFKEKEILSEHKHKVYMDEFGNAFDARMGAEAIRDLLKKMDLEELSHDLRVKLDATGSKQTERDIIRRLKVVEAFRESGNHPEWMILEVIPVIPPDLRPLVPLDGGRFATSDLNDLYRRVINRNNRLSRLLELKAPEIIVRNEKRMLQEAVDALFDNGRMARPIKGQSGRPLKSLSDALRGKQGRFRQNLLGKRVDFSGRSVIAVGPKLKLNQCGLPKVMALELFKPFIYHKLMYERCIAPTLKAAKKMVERGEPEVWDALDEVVKGHPVLLNRAPTLHRPSIQAFEPVLVEGKAIRIHPLVCTPFNADFDGDQMAVHVPLSYEAQAESSLLILASHNILSPAHGKPLTYPTQDIVLGCYYLTKPRAGSKGEGKVFANPQEVVLAYDEGMVGLQARIKVRLAGKLYDTTGGRVVLYEIVPPEIPFDMVNRVVDKKVLQRLVMESVKRVGNPRTVKFLDDLKNLGFYQATRSGISISVGDMEIPPTKREVVDRTFEEVLDVEDQYLHGYITRGEKYNKVVGLWAQATEEVTQEMIDNLRRKDREIMEEQGYNDDGTLKEFNSIYTMADSGARGGTSQIRQLAAMRGLMAKPSGEIIETPITSNFREGLTVLQYFVSTHGARKGLADTALKTANAGYLTRKLVDVSHAEIIVEEDCSTIDGVYVEPVVEGGEIIESLSDRIVGRISLEDIQDPFSEEGEYIVRAGEEIDEEKAKQIEESGIRRVAIRSILTCECKNGVCAACYGRDLATGRKVALGEAVGVIAAQSIGEPGTQLTMRTFHIGGTATVFEVSSHDAKTQGFVKYHNIRTITNKDSDLVVMNRNGEVKVVDDKGKEKESYPVTYGAILKVKDGAQVKPGELLVTWDPYSIPILSEASGRVKFGDIIEGITMKEEVDEVSGMVQRVVTEFKEEKRLPRVSIKGESNKTIGRYPLPAGAHIMVSEGDTVSAGDIVAKIPRETAKTKDITGGLPKVIQLFEARKGKDKAVITEIDGDVEIGSMVRGKRKVIIRGEHETREYLIPRAQTIVVRTGDYVRAGEPLVDGTVDPHDILEILGVKALQKYLVDEVQKVYRLQGVEINDKHIEVIVRQMLRRVRVDDPGDTRFLPGDEMSRFGFEEENRRVMEEGGRPAVGRVLLQGIAKAALYSESFISAASFQETTKVLTEAAIAGRLDPLMGLKENVILGRLVPAGTGVEEYRETEVRIKREFVSKEEPLDSEE